ncbi:MULTISPECIES: sensor domain-containing diguanylate cyclase [unclassified Solibacillus]|uniref:sensor domain-containing diguanylate cyclase n=1 Tax=unclassified Solibacillus TaxID=2637870 RepID=UPI0030FB3F2E
MVENQLKIDQFKSNILNLCMNSNIQQNKLHDYFLLLEESLADFFKMEDCFLFHLIDNNLKPVTNLNYYNIDFNLLVPYLNGNKVVELPKFLKELSYFRNHTNIMPLMSNNKIDGIIVFKYKKTTPPFEIQLTEDIIINISSVHKYLVQNYEVHSNEQKYRKLYGMTDLFHSTMDIDVILQNVLITIEDNFSDLEVELILSNDQDRQTKIQIKPFDYLSERPSTIEAFVSGELKEDIAIELDCRLLNVPIKGRQAIYGILQVKAPINYSFTNSEKEFIKMLAQASGNALENAKLYHQSHRLISDLQLINETSHRLNMKLTINEMLLFLQKQLLKSFQPMEVGFLFKGKDHYEMTEVCTPYFNQDKSLAYIHYVEKHFKVKQDPLFIADFSRLIAEEIEYKSVMAIPMIVEEKIIGFSIVLHQEPYFFSFDSFKLMQSLIHHSSLAISNSVLREQLQEMVDRDHLTKLYARSYSDTYVEKSIQKDDSGMFLLIDIDNFKKVNDTFGHQVGDKVLVQIAVQLKKKIGLRGICSRWGGEELAIYIPNILEDEAMKVSKELVDLIPKVTKPSVTISAGMVTWYKGKRPDFQHIFLQADTALYNAKSNGKNRVCVFESSMELKC